MDGPVCQTADDYRDAVEGELLRERELVLEARAEVARSRNSEVEAVAELTRSEERAAALAAALELAAAENERLRESMRRPLVVSYADPDGQPASVAAMVDLSGNSGRSPGRSWSPHQQAPQQDRSSGALEVIDARLHRTGSGSGSVRSFDLTASSPSSMDRPR